MTLYSLVAISIGLMFPACRLFGDEASDPRQRFLLSAPDHKVGEDRYFYVIVNLNSKDRSLHLYEETPVMGNRMKVSNSSADVNEASLEAIQRRRVCVGVRCHILTRCQRCPRFYQKVTTI